MFSRFQRFYNSVKIVTDLLVLAVSFGLAYLTRFFGPVSWESLPTGEETVMSLVMVLVIFPMTFHKAHLYTTNRARTHLGEIFEIFKATLMAALILIALTYFTRERYSRLTLGIFISYAFVLLSVTRLATRELLNEVRRRGFNLRHILIVGGEDLGRRVIQTIHEHRELGFRVAGVLTRLPAGAETSVDGAPVLGSIAEIGRVLDQRTFDQVIIALPIQDQPLVKPLMDELALRTVDVKIVPDLYQYITLCGGLEEFGGLPIINLQSDPLDGWNRVTKRLFDMLLGLAALVLVSPVMVLVGLAVKLTSRGPMLYRQERMGLDGRLFHILKFRTMSLDAERHGAQMARAKDGRTTWIGGWLRRLSIDELPQFWNVVCGDMSLVGPRPERPIFIEEFKRQIPRYHLRHKVKAGITGWAQVNGLRGQTSIEKRIEYDLYYIENWSLLLDLKILARTALGGFLSRNAY